MTNKVLRKHFVRCLDNAYPQNLVERQTIKECFRRKKWVLSNFRDIWAQPEDGEEGVEFAQARLAKWKTGTAYPYDDVAEWEIDSEIESEDEQA